MVVNEPAASFCNISSMTCSHNRFTDTHFTFTTSISSLIEELQFDVRPITLTKAHSLYTNRTGTPQMNRFLRGRQHRSHDFIYRTNFSMESAIMGIDSVQVVVKCLNLKMRSLRRCSSCLLNESCC